MKRLFAIWTDLALLGNTHIIVTALTKALSAIRSDIL